MVPSAGMSMGQLQRGGGGGVGAPLRRHLHYVLILASVMPVSLKSTYSFLGLNKLTYKSSCIPFLSRTEHVRSVVVEFKHI
jgi:hypothetical protein